MVHNPSRGFIFRQFFLKIQVKVVMELKFIDTNKIFRKQSNNESPYFRIEKAYTCKKLSSFHISTAHSSF